VDVQIYGKRIPMSCQQNSISVVDVSPRPGQYDSAHALSTFQALEIPVLNDLPVKKSAGEIGKYGRSNNVETTNAAVSQPMKVCNFQHVR
jgi:hypothetical protein